MLYRADEEGKVRIALNEDGFDVSFSITGRDGRAFAPGEVVEYTDVQMYRLLTELLIPFHVESVLVRGEPA